MTEFFNLGIVVSPFGLGGFVKVKSFSGETGHFSALKTVNLCQNGKADELSIEEIAQTGENSVILVKFRGIDNPEAAKKLSGAKLSAARSFAAPLKQDEYYIEDLKGLCVYAINADSGEYDRETGRITDIIEGGNGALMEIRLLSGGVKLVPFRNEFIGEINIEKGRAVLLQPWILEE